jgi:hypothetical protein
MRVRSGAAALVVVIGFGMLSACSSTTCVSWHVYDSEQQLFDDTELVVVGTAEPTGATREVIGVTMPVYRIEVADILKGEAPDPLEVTPAPLTCMADRSEYPDGVNPFDAGDESVFFLYDDDASGWRATSPYQGVLPVPDDGVLPFEVPDR